MKLSIHERAIIVDTILSRLGIAHVKKGEDANTINLITPSLRISLTKEENLFSVDQGSDPMVVAMMVAELTSALTLVSFLPPFLNTFDMDTGEPTVVAMAEVGPEVFITKYREHMVLKTFEIMKKLKKEPTPNGINND